MEYSDSSRNNSAHVFQADQHRNNVSKQILFLKDHDRLQWRLNSEGSELSFDQHDDSLELIEKFKGIHCVMQEKLADEGDRQFIRTLTAQDAVYHYKNKELLADNAIVDRYMVPGITWIDSFKEYTPVMTGKADKIELSFKYSQPAFRALKFQATINREQGL